MFVEANVTIASCHGSINPRCMLTYQRRFVLPLPPPHLSKLFVIVSIPLTVQCFLGECAAPLWSVWSCQLLQHLNLPEQQSVIITCSHVWQPICSTMGASQGWVQDQDLKKGAGSRGRGNFRIWVRVHINRHMCSTNWHDQPVPPNSHIAVVALVRGASISLMPSGKRVVLLLVCCHMCRKNGGRKEEGEVESGRTHIFNNYCDNTQAEGRG